MWTNGGAASCFGHSSAAYHQHNGYGHSYGRPSAAPPFRANDLPPAFPSPAGRGYGYGRGRGGGGGMQQRPFRQSPGYGSRLPTWPTYGHTGAGMSSRPAPPCAPSLLAPELLRLAQGSGVNKQTQQRRRVPPTEDFPPPTITVASSALALASSSMTVPSPPRRRRRVAKMVFIPSDQDVFEEMARKYKEDAKREASPTARDDSPPYKRSYVEPVSPMRAPSTNVTAHSQPNGHDAATVAPSPSREVAQTPMDAGCSLQGGSADCQPTPTAVAAEAVKKTKKHPYRRPPTSIYGKALVATTTVPTQMLALRSRIPHAARVYWPSTTHGICGNQQARSELMTWLRRAYPVKGQPRPSATRCELQQRKKRRSQSNCDLAPRAAILHGLSDSFDMDVTAYLTLQEMGYEVFETSMADGRSASEMRTLLSLCQNRSLTAADKPVAILIKDADQWPANKGGRAVGGKKRHAMRSASSSSSSGGNTGGDDDGGGGGELSSFGLLEELLNDKSRKQTKIPIIFTCESIMRKKLRDLSKHCLSIRFFVPAVEEIKSPITAMMRYHNIQSYTPEALQAMAEAARGNVNFILHQLDCWLPTLLEWSPSEGRHVQRWPLDAERVQQWVQRGILDQQGTIYAITKRIIHDPFNPQRMLLQYIQQPDWIRGILFRNLFSRNGLVVPHYLAREQDEHPPIIRRPPQLTGQQPAATTTTSSSKTSPVETSTPPRLTLRKASCQKLGDTQQRSHLAHWASNVSDFSNMAMAESECWEDASSSARELAFTILYYSVHESMNRLHRGTPTKLTSYNHIRMEIFPEQVLGMHQHRNLKELSKIDFESVSGRAVGDTPPARATTTHANLPSLLNTLTVWQCYVQKVLSEFVHHHVTTGNKPTPDGIHHCPTARTLASQLGIQPRHYRTIVRLTKLYGNRLLSIRIGDASRENLLDMFDTGSDDDNDDDDDATGRP